MKHLLAPVPAVHIPSARVTYAREGVVAFGSNAFDVLNPLRGQEVTVWLAASATDAPATGVEGVAIGRVIWRGNLRAITDATPRGRHPNEAIRPTTTLDDSEYHYGQFWEIDSVEEINPGLSIVGIRTLRGARLTALPHGPILIREPEGAP